MLFEPNPNYSRRFLIKFILGIVFIGTLVWWTFEPSSGEREFRRSREALKHATSWREDVPPGGGYEQQMEVSCATQSAHLVRESRPPSSGMNVIQEDTRIGASTYSRHAVRYEQNPSGDATSDWQHGSFVLTSNPCNALAGGSKFFALPDYEEFIQTGVITRGDKDYIHGAVCRNWKVKVVARRYGASGENVEICIGVDDHLPYRMNREGTVFVFYDWNQPISIDEPTVVEHPRVWPQYSGYPQWYNYSAQQRDSDPPVRYISPTPPPLPEPPVPPPPPPDGNEDDPRSIS